MDKLLPHPDLCKNNSLETFARAVMQADKQLQGADMKWKDVRDNSYLSDFTEDDWKQYAITDSKLIAETFDVLFMMGLIEIAKGKPSKILKASVTQKGRDWFALTDDNELGRAFQQALATTWFAQLDTRSFGVFNDSITVEIGEQDKAQVQATYNLLTTYELIYINNETTQINLRAMVSDTLQDEDAHTDYSDEDTLNNNERIAEETYDNEHSSEEEADLEDGFNTTMDSEDSSNEVENHSDEDTLNNNERVAEETYDNEHSSEEEADLEDGFNTTMDSEDSSNEVENHSDEDTLNNNERVAEETYDNEHSSEEEEADLEDGFNTAMDSEDSSNEAENHSDEDTLNNNERVAEETYDNGHSSEEEADLEDGFNTAMDSEDTSNEAENASDEEDASNEVATNSVSEDTSNDDTAEKNDNESQEKGFKSATSGAKPPRATREPISKKASDDGDEPPALRVGQSSGLGRLRQGTSDAGSNSEKDKTASTKGEDNPPPMIHPNKGANRRGGIKFGRREVRSGSDDESGGLPYIRPGRGGVKRPTSGRGQDPDLPSSRPGRGSTLGRRPVNVDGLPSGGSGMDEFRRAGRKNRNDSGGEGQSSPAKDTVEHIIGGIINDIKVDIVLKNDQQYEIYENEERVFYVPRSDIEVWQNKHGEDHVADAIMNYRDDFFNRSLNNPEQDDE